MTAATLTRTRRSAFPTTVEELTPLARDYAAELGETPSRNQLMKRFHVGDKKAKALLVALAADVPAEPDRPALRPVVILEDETQKYADLAPSALAAAEPDTEHAPPVTNDTRGPEPEPKPYSRYGVDPE